MTLFGQSEALEGRPCPEVECAATPLPFISLRTSVIAHAHLAQISTPATGRTKIGRLAAGTDVSEKDGGAERRESGMKNWNEKWALSVSK